MQLTININENLKKILNICIVIFKATIKFSLVVAFYLGLIKKSMIQWFIIVFKWRNKMSRSTSFVGFTKQAEEIKKELVKKYYVSNYNSMGKPVDVEGMFGEIVYNCMFYYEGKKLKYHEYIQAEPWSSGLCIFMALWDDENNCPVLESMWGVEEIEREL